MDFSILGSLDVADAAGEASAPTAPRVRALLARLLIDRDRVVSTDELVDDLWPEGELRDGSSALRFHVWKLRNALEAGRRRGSVVIRHGPGYTISMDGHRCDADRFDWLVRRARRRGTDDPAGACSDLETALGWWRGPALLDVRYEEFAQAAIRRLEDDRRDAEVLLARRLLDIGRETDAVALLRKLLERSPFADAAWELLLTAHLAGDRIGDAYNDYARASDLYEENLGAAVPQRLEQLMVAAGRDITGRRGERPGRPPPRRRMDPRRGAVAGR